MKLADKPRLQRHFRSLSSRPDANLMRHMLTEDLHLGIVPIGNHFKRSDFWMTISGPDGDKPRARALLERLGRQAAHRTDTEIVSHAIETIANGLSTDGRVVYELVQGDGNVAPCWVTTRRLFRLPGYYLQLIPTDDVEPSKGRWRASPAEAIWDVRFPASLGGPSRYRKVIADLERFDGLGPHFWREKRGAGPQDVVFDFGAYNRWSEAFIRFSVRDWGWNQRDWRQDRSTEFFSFYRAIRFQRTKTALREHIVSELNALLTRLGIPCIIEVHGLPTPADCDRVLGELLAGAVDFGAAMDAVKTS